jgi:hypothetical protein
MEKGKYRVSLEVAKKLKDAGFPQDACDAYWSVGYSGKLCDTQLVGISQSKSKYRTYYAAPCVGRLGEELPNRNKCRWFTEQVAGLISWIGRIWECNFLPGRSGEYIYGAKFDKNFAGKNEADARALLWIELKKRGLL